MNKFPHIFLTGHPSVGKTTIVKGVQSSIQQQCGSYVKTSGFYTEECRKGGNRVGFDIVYWPTTTRTCSSTITHQHQPRHQPQRMPLSRIMDRVQKGKPFVGKYLVNIDNVQQYAVASILHSSHHYNDDNDDDNDDDHNHDDNNKSDCAELIILDEIGKMEMKCPQFIPAVTKLLSATSAAASNRIILGTLPTPRYGRVIADVETIRARKDVLVVQVTKDNREELNDLLSDILPKALLATEEDIDEDRIRDTIIKSLEPYRYTRPIGASSMNGDKGNSKPTKKKSPTVDCKRATNASAGGGSSSSTPTIVIKPCGPLISPSIPPKILIVGETASPLPEDSPEHSYCERSMWIVLSKMFGLPPHKPILDPSSASEIDLARYEVVRTMALANGICVWDVLANVHQKGTRTKKQKPVDLPNDIQGLLNRHPSIAMIGFIGQKAHAKYKKLSLCDTAKAKRRKVELVTLPSSSPANTRLSVTEKANAWKAALVQGSNDDGISTNK
ncbi:MAG: hypothetical protein SGBAC_007347 [Bacillariaceae sp.]